MRWSVEKYRPMYHADSVQTDPALTLSGNSKNIVKGQKNCALFYGETAIILIIAGKSSGEGEACLDTINSWQGGEDSWLF